MRFYSGFSLKGEDCFFAKYIKDSVYTVCGFSYGAIGAFKYVQEQLKEGKRVDTLQLFSPAFFQDTSDKFKKIQILGYKKNPSQYLEQFISQCFMPCKLQTIQHSDTKVEDLEELLEYKWSIKDLKSLENRGVTIEVYLGGEDKIINAKAAQEVFLEVATVTYIKKANHFLQID